MESKLLQYSWYYQSPIDFEHKQWILFSYLKKVDEAFYNKNFSPWLLHTEKIVDDMRVSLEYIESFRKKITKKSIFFSIEGLSLIENKPSEKETETVEEILKFSIPLLDQRVELGRKLFLKYPTILHDKEL
jgi:hypothetical protein